MGREGADVAEQRLAELGALLEDGGELGGGQLQHHLEGLGARALAALDEALPHLGVLPHLGGPGERRPLEGAGVAAAGGRGPVGTGVGWRDAPPRDSGVGQTRGTGRGRTDTHPQGQTPGLSPRGGGTGQTDGQGDTGTGQTDTQGQDSHHLPARDSQPATGTVTWGHPDRRTPTGTPGHTDTPGDTGTERPAPPRGAGTSRGNNSPP